MVGQSQPQCWGFGSLVCGLVSVPTSVGFCGTTAMSTDSQLGQGDHGRPRDAWGAYRTLHALKTKGP